MNVLDNVCTIERYCSNGWGRTRYTTTGGLQRSVAVPGVLQGEQVILGNVCKEAVDDIRRVGCLQSLVEISPFRKVPECPHFLQCGGCSFQHMDYAEQVRLKHQMIVELFSQIGQDGANIDSMIEAPSRLGYRNKLEFSFSQDVQGRRYLGLYAGHKPKRVVDLSTCVLAPTWTHALLEAVRSYWRESGLTAYHPYRKTGSLISLTVREGQTTGDIMIMLTVSSNPEYALSRRSINRFVEKVREALPQDRVLSIVVRIKQSLLGRPTQYYEMIVYEEDHIRERLTVEVIRGSPSCIEFHLGPSSFFQPNTQQAMRIYSTALQMAQLQDHDTVFDLYCGVGIFGIFATQIASKAYGIELSPESAYDATVNAKRLGCSKFQVQTGDVAAVIASLPRKETRGSVIIVDPPRVGLMPKAIEQISRISADRMVYVSCNPRSQIADVQALGQFGWKVQRVCPVDQFPQTPHVENIVSLCRA